MPRLLEKETYRRWLYRGGRAHGMASALNRLQAAIAAAGLPPHRVKALEVRGRRTGRRITLPVVVADFNGERYLVAMLGAGANWVANVRAAGGKAVLRHGRRESILLEEVEPRERAPLLKHYLDVAPGARAHFSCGSRSSPFRVRGARAALPRVSHPSRPRPRGVDDVRGEMHGKLSDASVVFSFWPVSAFRDGKTVRTEWFADRAEALKAVGLEE